MFLKGKMNLTFIYWCSIKFLRSSLKSSKPHQSTYLELALTGEDADPLVIIVGNDDITTRVHSHAGGSLQLTGRTSTHPKTSLEFPLVGENLEWGGTREDHHTKTHTLASYPHHLNPRPFEVMTTENPPYLDTLIVAVSNQNPAAGGGSNSLKVGELPFIPPLRTWREQGNSMNWLFDC